MLKPFAPALSLAILLPATLLAQSGQRYSLQISRLQADLYGPAFRDSPIAGGWEVQMRVTPGVWSYGFGYQFTAHHSPALNTRVKLSGVFFEPRRVIPLTRFERFAPYLAGRFAALNQTADSGRSVVGGGGAVTFNAGGGLLVNLIRRVNVDMGTTFGYQSFGDFKVITSCETNIGIPTCTFRRVKGSGADLVARIGLSVGLGDPRER